MWGKRGLAAAILAITAATSTALVTSASAGSVSLLSGQHPMVGPILGQLELANTGGKGVCAAAVSPDGSTAFYAIDLPVSSSGPDASGLYSRNLATGAEKLLRSFSGVGAPCGTFSPDGTQYAWNAGDGVIHLLDVASGAQHVVSSTAQSVGQFSDDDRYLFYTAGFTLYRYDLSAATSSQCGGPAAPHPDGDSAIHNGEISADGQRIAFTYYNPLAEVAVCDFPTGTAEVIPSVNGGPDDDPMLSADGSHVAFEEYSKTGPPYTVQAYEVDVVSGARTPLSDTPAGQPANGGTGPVAISADGGTVALSSTATNLVSGITVTPPSGSAFGSAEPLYVHEAATGKNVLVTSSVNGARNADDGGESVTMNAAGDTLAFLSHADDLVGGYQPPAKAPTANQVWAWSVADRSATLVSADAAMPTAGIAESNFTPTIARSGGTVFWTVGGTNFGVGPIPYVATVGTPPTPVPTSDPTPSPSSSPSPSPSSATTPPPALGSIATAGSSSPAPKCSIPSAGRNETPAAAGHALAASHCRTAHDVDTPAGHPRAPRGQHFVVGGFALEHIAHVRKHGKTIVVLSFQHLSAKATLPSGTAIALVERLVHN